MKSNDENKKAEKSLSNLKGQEINTDKVQGGLKISYDNLIRERNGFSDTKHGNETPTGGGSAARRNPTQGRTDDRK